MRLLAAALLVTCAPLGHASAQEGVVEARIVDARSAVALQGALVTVGEAARASSGPDGRVRVVADAGVWPVEVALIGRATVRLSDVAVIAGATTDLGTIGLDYDALEVSELVVSVTPGTAGERRIEAPSHVEVVGEAEVARRITVGPADHLRGVSAVDVMQQGLQSTNVVVRGFNSVFSGSLHALTDHRLVGLPSLAVNLLHFLPSNDLDVQRVEVVLGPGSALYGPNTADGVLHVLTHSPLAQQGTSVSVAGGERSFFKGAVRTAHLVTPDLGVKLSGQWLTAEEWFYEDPVEVANRASADADPDEFKAEVMARGFGPDVAERAFERMGIRDYGIRRWGVEARADWRFDDRGTLVLTAGRTGSSGIELTGLGADQIVDFGYSFYQVRASRERLFAQTYVTMGDAGDTYLLRDGLPLIESSWQWVSQLQHGWTSAGRRQALTYGVDQVRTVPRSQGTVYGIYEDRDVVDQGGVYVQSETALRPRWDLVLSGRADVHSELDDPVFSPRAALIFKPDERQSVRLTYNRAFTTPSAVNLFLDVSAGRAPELLGALGYRLRAQGTGADGFTFVRPDGSLAGMRSPFNPGGASQLLPVDVAVAWPLAVGAAAGIAAAQGTPLDPGLVELLQGLSPSAADVGLAVLDPTTGRVSSLVAADIDNVPGLGESTTTTWEIGYEGVLGGRVRVAVDGWLTRRRDFISPLVLKAPLLLLDGESVGAFVAGPWIERRVGELVAGGAEPAAARAQAEAEAAVVVPAVATALGSVPVAVASAPEVDASAADMLVTYVNVGEVDLRGADVSFQWLLDDRWTLAGSASLVSEDWFEIDDGPPIALNAPARKAVLSLARRTDELDVEARFRWAAGFPASSAELVGTSCVTGDTGGIFEEGCVEATALVDLTAGWTLPGTRARLQLTVTDLFDQGYRSFVGVPEIGRFALVGVRYDL